MNKLLTVLTSLALVGAVACGGAATADDQKRITAIAALTPDLENGDKLFDATCSDCHGEDGKSGTEKINAAAVAKGEKDDAIGQVLAGEDEMPAFRDQFTDQEIADIVGYLASKN